MLNKEYNTLEGLQQKVNIIAALNLGLSKELKEAYPLTAPAEKSKIGYNVDYSNLSTEWVAGFLQGSLTYLFLHKIIVVYLYDCVFNRSTLKRSLIIR